MCVHEDFHPACLDCFRDGDPVSAFNDLRAEVKRLTEAHDFERNHRAVEEQNVAILAAVRAGLLARIADLESRVRSDAIVEQHLRATIKALTRSGQYDAGKLEEGLDGQVLREGKYG